MMVKAAWILSENKSTTFDYFESHIY